MLRRRFAPLASEAPLDATDEALLTAIDAGVPWAQLLSSASCEPEEAEGRLMRLHHLGLVEGLLAAVGNGRVEALSQGGDDDGFDSQPTHRISVTLPPVAPPAKHAEPPPAASPQSFVRSRAASDPSAELAPELRAKLQVVDDMLARMSTTSYYELLGVPDTASMERIRKAYFELSKRFHPDAYFRKSIGGYRAKLSVLFAALTNAHDVLRSPQDRAVYDLSLGLDPMRPLAVAPAAKEGVAAKAPPRADATPARSMREQVQAASKAPPRTDSAPARAARELVDATSLTPPRADSTPARSMRERVEAASKASPLDAVPARPTQHVDGTSKAPPRDSLPARSVPAAPATRPPPDTLLTFVARELERQPGVHAWAAARLLDAALAEEANQLEQAAAILDAVLVRVSDPRIRRERDRIRRLVR